MPATTVPAVQRSVLDAIGNTPAVRLRRLVDDRCAEVIVKLEYYNPSGSYKDRMAVAMIEGAIDRGVLKPGMRVVEYTGGSTGSSLALVCAVKGLRFTPVTSDAFALEKTLTMRALGAEPIIVPSGDGKVRPELFGRMRAEVDRLLAEGGSFWTDQFHNPDALDGYRGIGRELAEQTAGRLDVFCGAIGTAGMLVGVSRALKDAGCRARASSRPRGGDLRRHVHGPQRRWRGSCRARARPRSHRRDGRRGHGTQVRRR